MTKYELHFPNADIARFVARKVGWKPIGKYIQSYNLNEILDLENATKGKFKEYISLLIKREAK